MYSSCVRSAMLHASETWPLTKTNLQRLQRNDRAMIRQICSIKPEDVARVRSSQLLAKLQLEDLDLILRERRLRWFGHVARSSGAIRTAYDMQIDGKRGAGRPKQTWKTDRERLPWVEAHHSWPSRKEHLEIRCEICYACSKPVTWKGAHWCGWCPCTCTLIKNPIMMIYDQDCWSSWSGSKLFVKVISRRQKWRLTRKELNLLFLIFCRHNVSLRFKFKKFQTLHLLNHINKLNLCSLTYLFIRFSSLSMNVEFL